jgi:hypothetical protein
MFARSLIVSVLLQIAATCDATLPAFQQYRVGTIYKGKAATPILRTSEDRQYRTRIRIGSAKGPNFAGHYTVILLGCGTQCASFLIVDAKTGRVYSRAQKEYTCWPYHKLDSRLLVTDVCSGAIETNCGRAFWEWTGTELNLLARAPITCTADPPEGFDIPASSSK